MAAPAVTTAKVVVKDHPLFGRSAYAAENISAGELVICEEPLLFYDNVRENNVLKGLLKQVQQYLKAHPSEAHQAAMIHEQDWIPACGFYLEFCRASEKVQHQVLHDMHNDPQGPGIEHTAPVVRTAVQASVLAALAPEVTKILKIMAVVAAGGAAAAAEVQDASSDPALIQRVLLAAELNVHGLGRSAAMYAVGSKLAHTCASPNTYYMSYKGRGCHVAMRDIAEGEVLTTTYLPVDNQVMSLFARKAYLRDTFSFDCVCERCSSTPDTLSALPCPRCTPPELARKQDGYLPPAFLQASSSCSGPPTGLLHFDPRKADPASLIPSNNADAGCCGCGHDHGEDGHHHNHDHHHHHGEQHAHHSHGGHGHHHAPAAAAAASGAAAPTAAGAAAAGEEEAEEEEEDAFKPWQCNKCGVELPDRDLALVGDYRLVQQATTRLENWALGNALNFDPRQGQDRLRNVVLILGPYHWAVHFMMNRQTEYFQSMVKGIGGLLPQQGKLSASHLNMLGEAASGMQVNLGHTWSWLTGAGGLDQEAAARIMCQSLVYSACSLLEASSHMQMIPKLAASQAQLISSMQQLADILLARAEPALAHFRHWPLQDPHPLIRVIELARQLAAKAAAAAAAGGAAGGDERLSMNQLLDFLPATSSKAGAAGGASSGSSKAKSKKKAGGKR